MFCLSRTAAALGFILMAAACATISPVSRIEAQLVDLGVSNARAECLAETLDEELERDDLNASADFLEGLKSGKPAEPTFRSALETQKVCDAVLNSAKKKQWVKVK